MRKLTGIIILQTFIFCMSFGIELIYPSGGSSTLSSNVVTNNYNGNISAINISANVFKSLPQGNVFLGARKYGGNLADASTSFIGLSNQNGGFSEDDSLMSSGIIFSQDSSHKSSISFKTGDGDNYDTKWMLLNSSGNLGVGMTNPSTRLEVAGTVSASALRVNGNGDFAGTITANMFVGDGSGLTGVPATLTGSFIGTVNVIGVVSASSLILAGVPFTGTTAISSNVLTQNYNGSAVFSGTITANKFAGDGSSLTGVTVSKNIYGSFGATGTINANALESNLDAQFNTIPLADLNVTGLTSKIIYGDTIARFDACYVSSTGKIVRAKGNSASTMPAIFLAAEAGTDTQQKKILINGFARNDAWNFTAGALVYVSETTTGSITQTVPTGSGTVLQPIGVAVSSDVVYFKPELLTITLQ